MHRQNQHTLSIGASIKLFLEHARAHGYSAQSQNNFIRYLDDFERWARAHKLRVVADVCSETLEEYLRYLADYRKADGGELAWHAKEAKLIPLRTYLRWLSRQEPRLAMAAADLKLGRKPLIIPKGVLSEDKVRRVFEQADLSTPGGIRDRAMLETLFSCGIRRSELVALDVADVDFNAQTLLIRSGKGAKDRIIPIGSDALHWIQRYLTEARPQLLNDPTPALFVSARGERWQAAWMSTHLGDYIRKALPGQRGACHLFRHSMATLMLDNGADIRHIQQMLGHADLSTTQIYTRVSIDSLKKVHAKTHPGLSSHEAKQEQVVPPRATESPIPESASPIVGANPPAAKKPSSWLELACLAALAGLEQQRNEAKHR